METVWFATGAQFRMHRERIKIAHNNAKRRWLWLAAKFVSGKTLGHLVGQAIEPFGTVPSRP